VGFEPTRGDPIGLAGRRLNHSAKVSSDCGANPLLTSLAGLASRHPPWKISHRAAGAPPRDGTAPSAPSPHTAPQRSPTRMARSVQRGQNLLNSKPQQQFRCYCISAMIHFDSLGTQARGCPISHPRAASHPRRLVLRAPGRPPAGPPNWVAGWEFPPWGPTPWGRAAPKLARIYRGRRKWGNRADARRTGEQGGERRRAWRRAAQNKT
jgi:hypothetical protein